MNDLRKAAQALVDRWDTPLWKDAPHTGQYIDALRAALAQPELDPASASAWWTLVMGAAAELENASICLRDEDAKRRAISGAKYYRDAAKELWAAVVRAVEKAHGIGGEE